MIRWRKLGIVYGPDGSLSWASSHAMIPTPILIDNDIIRVYITCRDSQGIGRPSFVEVSATNPLNVLRVNKSPVIDVGDPGTFDENGVLCCSVVKENSDRYYMYYAGFELGNRIRYRLLTGVAQSTDGGLSFERFQKTPILERSEEELYFRGGPFCIKSKDKYRLWYVAGSKWIDLNGTSSPSYDIRYLESIDGLTWPSTGRVVIPVVDPEDYAFGRPSVMELDDGRIEMFYSVRKRSLGSYRLGYALSTDGREWRRCDTMLNLQTSDQGFDSEAIMYAAPLRVGSISYLFYNGNCFGKDGFAVAKRV